MSDVSKCEERDREYIFITEKPSVSHLLFTTKSHLPGTCVQKAGQSNRRTSEECYRRKLE